MSALPEFKLSRPSRVSEAVAALTADPGARLVAGGTDLIPNLRRGLGQPSALIDVSGLTEMTALERTPEQGLRIGGAVTLATLADDAAVRAEWPAVAVAAGSVAGPTHRLNASVAGNLCVDTRCVYYNESDWWRSGQGYCLKYGGDRCHVVPKSDRCYAVYSGDLAPALLVLNAELEVVGGGGERRVALRNLYREDGRDGLTLAPDEIIVAVRVPPANGIRSTYEKVRIRDAIDFPLVGVACALRRDGDALDMLRVAYTGTNSCPVLLEGLDDLIGHALTDELVEELNVRLEHQIAPLKTTTTGPRYKRRVAKRVTERVLRGLYGESAEPR